MATPVGYYKPPFPTEAAADRRAACESCRLWLRQLRDEAEVPTRPLAYALLLIETMREFVAKARGEGAGELLGALGELRRAFETFRGPLPASVTLRREVQSRLLPALDRCDRALEEWRP